MLIKKIKTGLLMNKICIYSWHKNCTFSNNPIFAFFIWMKSLHKIFSHFYRFYIDLSIFSSTFLRKCLMIINYWSLRKSCSLRLIIQNNHEVEMWIILWAWNTFSGRYEVCQTFFESFIWVFFDLRTRAEFCWKAHFRILNCSLV